MPNFGNLRRDKEAAAGIINRELATLSKMLHLAQGAAGWCATVGRHEDHRKTEAVHRRYAIVSDADLAAAAVKLTAAW